MMRSPSQCPGWDRFLGREGPLVDREHRMLKPRPTPFGALLSTPVISPGAQRGTMVRSQPRWPQQSPSRLIDGLVDALVTQPHPRLLGELQAQVTTDLLWAPPLGQKLRDQLPQFAVALDASPMIAGTTRGRAPVGIERTVTPTLGRVAAQLPRHCRGCPTQPIRDLPDAQARVAQIGNLDPLVLRQEPRADLTHSQPLQHRYEPDDLTVAVGLVTTRPVVSVVRETPTSRAAARMLHPRSRSSTNR
jgi:hypothetical protein